MIQVTRLFLLFVVLGLVGCGDDGPAGRQEIVIFAAASLTDAFMELAAEFETQNPGVQVFLNFGGSSQLAAQLREGAAADLFAPANPAQMAAVIAAGRIEAGADVIFVSNQLTVIIPADNQAGINTLDGLAQPGVQLILAVPGVPVREYTDELIATMDVDFQARFYGNLVSAEDNVRQVVAKVALGEADAGIVYSSDITPDIAGQVRQIAIPAAQNVIAVYPIAPLADAAQPALAQRFLAFLLSADGQAILSRWGFGPPPGG